MKNWYEVGKVYIWQNQVKTMAFLNGTECVILGNMDSHWCEIAGGPRWGQETDSMDPSDECYYFAEQGDLRPKNPPPGEQSITNLFKLTEPELV